MSPTTVFGHEGDVEFTKWLDSSDLLSPVARRFLIDSVLVELLTSVSWKFMTSEPAFFRGYF